MMKTMLRVIFLVLTDFVSFSIGSAIPISTELMKSTKKTF